MAIVDLRFVHYDWIYLANQWRINFEKDERALVLSGRYGIQYFLEEAKDNQRNNVLGLAIKLLDFCLQDYDAETWSYTTQATMEDWVSTFSAMIQEQLTQV